MRWLPALGAAVLIAAGCGYPDFQFGLGGRGGETTTTLSSSGSGGTGAGGMGGQTSSSATSSSTTSSGCAIDHVVISEIRTRGVGGATDEFVELYNPTGTDVLLDATWTLDARAATISSVTYSTRWSGNNHTIPAHGHFLIVGGGYNELPTSDGKLGSSLTDSASLVLNRAGSAIDSVCFYYDAPGLLTLTTAFPAFTCSGSPAVNPHNDSTGTDIDASIERRPGGAAGNCTDTGDNASDFATASPATPADALSAPAPG